MAAAVVGVILNLAVVFRAAVIWPGGPGHAPDFFALDLAAVSFSVLLLLDLDAVWVVLAGAGVGLLRAFTGIAKTWG